LFQHAVVKIPGQELRVIILMDRTEEEKSRKALEDLREKTMDVTQQVINEQMRTAQEIASLLGEATARSKIAMVQLQKVMHGEDHG
jgi:uncharacterized Fe-S cluster-containing protein